MIKFVLTLQILLLMVSCKENSVDHSVVQIEDTIRSNSKKYFEKDLYESVGDTITNQSISYPFVIKMINSGDSIWEGYKGDSEDYFVRFQKKPNSSTYIFISDDCYKKVTDVIIVDSLLNPLNLYRFENLTEHALSERELIYVATFSSGKEVAIEFSEVFKISIIPQFSEVIGVIEKINITLQLSESNSSDGYFKSNLDDWMLLFDECLGWINRPITNSNFEVWSKTKKNLSI